MGGEFGVTSEAGQGSVFAFSIPIRDGGRAARRAAGARAGRPAPAAIVAVRGDATARVPPTTWRPAATGWSGAIPPNSCSGDGALPACDVLFAEGAVLAPLARAGRPARDASWRSPPWGTGRSASWRTAASPTRSWCARSRRRSSTNSAGAWRRASRCALSAASAAPARTPPPRFQGRRVLVADDSPVNREVAVEALARLGVQAEVAVDGRDASRSRGAAAST